MVAAGSGEGFFERDGFPLPVIAAIEGEHQPPVMARCDAAMLQASGTQEAWLGRMKVCWAEEQGRQALEQTQTQQAEGIGRRMKYGRWWIEAQAEQQQKQAEQDRQLAEQQEQEAKKKAARKRKERARARRVLLLARAVGAKKKKTKVKKGKTKTTEKDTKAPYFAAWDSTWCGAAGAKGSRKGRLPVGKRQGAVQSSPSDQSKGLGGEEDQTLIVGLPVLDLPLVRQGDEVPDQDPSPSLDLEKDQEQDPDLQPRESPQEKTENLCVCPDVLFAVACSCLVACLPIVFEAKRIDGDERTFPVKDAKEKAEQLSLEVPLVKTCHVLMVGSDPLEPEDPEPQRLLYHPPVLGPFAQGVPWEMNYPLSAVTGAMIPMDPSEMGSVRGTLPSTGGDMENDEWESQPEAPPEYTSGPWDELWMKLAELEKSREEITGQQFEEAMKVGFLQQKMETHYQELKELETQFLQLTNEWGGRVAGHIESALARVGVLELQVSELKNGPPLRSPTLCAHWSLFRGARIIKLNWTSAKRNI